MTMMNSRTAGGNLRLHHTDFGLARSKALGGHRRFDDVHCLLEIDCSYGSEGEQAITAGVPPMSTWVSVLRISGSRITRTPSPVTNLPVVVRDKRIA